MFTFMILFPIIIAIIGALMWGFCSNAKLARMGEILFAIGMFVFVFYAATKVVSCNTFTTTDTRR